MRRLGPSFLFLCLIALPSFAQDPPTPVSRKARFFRVVMGTSEKLTVAGFVDESKGTGKGYDRAVLDLDGDGTPEAVRKISEPAVLRLHHAGAVYTLTVHGLGDRVWRNETFHSSWTVCRDGLLLSFMSGRAPLYASPKDAMTRKPIRLGGPFRYEVRSRIEGPKAVLSVRLEDAMGGNLNGARRPNRIERIRVRLERPGTAPWEGRPDYG